MPGLRRLMKKTTEIVCEVVGRYRDVIKRGTTMGLGDLRALERDLLKAFGDEDPVLDLPVQSPVADAISIAAEVKQQRKLKEKLRAAGVELSPPSDEEPEDEVVEPVPEGDVTGKTVGELLALYSAEELGDMARDYDIAGRSSMLKVELAEAIVEHLNAEDEEGDDAE